MEKAKVKFLWFGMMLLALGLGLSDVTWASPCESSTNDLGIVQGLCPYGNPDDSMDAQDENNPGSGLILKNILLKNLTETSRVPCGIMEVESISFSGEFEFDLSGYGLLTGYERTRILLTGPVEVHTGPRNPGEPVETIQIEIVSMVLTSSDPDFGNLTVQAGAALGLLPSPGETTLTRLPGGNFAVDSFFDVSYRIDFVGDPCGVLAGSAGISEGGLHLNTPRPISPHLMLGTREEWQSALDSGEVQGMTATELGDYITEYNANRDAGSPTYPAPTTLMTPELYVFEGINPADGSEYPPGLVMEWGGDPCILPSGQDYAAAWRYVYPSDPDLTNTTITVTVDPPAGMNVVSIGLEDPCGNIRGWFWNVLAKNTPPPPPPYPVGSIPCSPDPCLPPFPAWQTTTVSIDLSLTGVGAATPTAASYSSSAGFDIKKVVDIKFDENNTWVGQVPAPSPGTGNAANWNYWHNLIITPNPGGGGGGGTDPCTNPADSKWYVKWSQPPVVINTGHPPLIHGWDEYSNYRNPPIAADDWKCTDKRPVTDIHWWGSFIGWTQPFPPPNIPTAFHLGIWTDVPAGADPCVPYSHPGTLVWENFCHSYVWNFAGYDLDPRVGEPCVPVGDIQENEACFQFAQFLSQDDWFYQEPNDSTGERIYWLSIAAIYNTTNDPPHPWGWKTRPHFDIDDAVQIQLVQDSTGISSWPPMLGYSWMSGIPLQLPPWPSAGGVSWDLSFELTTNEPVYVDNPVPGDLNFNKKIDLVDFGIFVANFLIAIP